jgi:hypothetical protein
MQKMSSIKKNLRSQTMLRLLPQELCCDQYLSKRMLQKVERKVDKRVHLETSNSGL